MQNPGDNFDVPLCVTASTLTTRLVCERQCPSATCTHQLVFAHGLKMFVLSGAAKAAAIRKTTMRMLFIV
jgi:hypothetical protein